MLVASASFWEGVDVPGDALQLVVIDKLPFPPPERSAGGGARRSGSKAQGRSPFNDYFVPEAAVALKQGAGRLIRRETDHGVLVICDTRLAPMGYGSAGCWRRCRRCGGCRQRGGVRGRAATTLAGRAERCSRGGLRRHHQSFHHGSSLLALEALGEVLALRVVLRPARAGVSSRSCVMPSASYERTMM